MGSLARSCWGRVVGLPLGVLLLYGFHLLGLNAQLSPGDTGEFISIDCGSDSQYEDAQGITWSPDDSYVTTGQKEAVNTTGIKLGNTPPSQTVQRLSTIRAFPGTQKKQCIVIPEALGSALYLVRLMFFAGNFSSEPVNFGLTIVNFDYGTVNITDLSTPTVKEFTFVTTNISTFSICLMRAVGTPFISSVELRPLPATFYQSNSILLASLVFETIFRWDCGAPANSSTLRYPLDSYDRLWDPPPSTYQFQAVSNFSAPIDNNTAYSPITVPTTVMQSAWTAPANESITLTWPVADRSWSVIVFGYLAELFSTPPNSLREVDGFVAGASMKTITYSSVIQNYYSINFSVDSNTSIVPTERSTLGPLMNAVEAYSVYYFNNSYYTWEDDVTSMAAITKSLNLTAWTGDPCVPYPWDWVTCIAPNLTTISTVSSMNLSGWNLVGSIPPVLYKLRSLTYLNLANNNLTGDISNLTFPETLKEVHMENNHFTGLVPISLVTLPDISNVTLDNNNLSGAIPEGIENKTAAGTLLFSASGNPNLCLTSDDHRCNATFQAPDPESHKKSSSNVGGIVGGVAGGVAALLGALLLLFCCWKRRKDASSTNASYGSKGLNPSPLSLSKNAGRFANLQVRVPHGRGFLHGKNSGGVSVMDPQQQCRRFSLAEVKAATNNFETEIGRGGFGLVYVGKLPDGQLVAVKVNKEMANQGEATPEFLNEVSLLSRTHHRNLVSLAGYCDEKDHQILIYVFMSEGTLRDHLFRGEADETCRRSHLNWETRLDIAYNSARGLEYLHNSCSPPIIHRDVKSNNILLNEEMLAKVADFGISKITSDKDRTRGITTQIKGTHGYLDPEYFMEQRLTTKSDVYSFGVILLEIVTGRKPSETAFPNARAKNLQDWVRDSVRIGDIHAIIDPQMGRKSYNVESIWKVVELALLCLDRQGTRRPDMQEVVAILLQAVQLQGHQTPLTGHSPSQLNPSNSSDYQRVHHLSSSDSGGAVSWGSQVTAR